jgi:hypothetical protein
MLLLVCLLAARDRLRRAVVSSKLSLTIPQILARRRNVCFSTGPQDREGRPNLNHRQAELPSRVLRNLEPRHGDPSDSRGVSRTGGETYKSEIKKRTNEAVILLKTKESLFSGGSKAVRSLKKGNLCGRSRQVLENNALSFGLDSRIGHRDCGSGVGAALVAAQATKGQRCHPYVRVKTQPRGRESEESKIVRTNPRCY